MPSIYALKRKHKKLQEEYDLKSEELRRLRKAHTIETDPSDKFKYEKQIEQREEEQKQFKQELEKLEHQIEAILSGVEGSPFQWNYDTLPIDFSPKIEFLTQCFVGRQKAIDRIDQFLQTHKSGYLAIVGEAGIGKSALLAHEVKKRGAVHHFVDDKQNSAKDEVFLRCIVEQLRQKYGFEFEERTPISVSEWNIYFQKWMKKACTKEEKLVICVDALDEAQHYGGSDSLLKYLPHVLPENVYFILTSRPEFKKEDITFLDSTVFECYELSPLNSNDIENYLVYTGRSPSKHRLEQKYKELHENYDLLSEKIEELRNAHTFQMDVAMRFKLQKQIQYEETELKKIEYEINALSEYLKNFTKGKEPNLILHFLQLYLPKLETQYEQLNKDLSSLNEDLQYLRNSYIIEADPILRFKLKKQINSIETEHCQVEQEIKSVENQIYHIIFQESEGNPLYLYYYLMDYASNHLPQGLTKFYEKQWHERIWIGDKAAKTGRKQILCLLLLLKEPASEEMLLELTGFDRVELQEYISPLHHFITTGERYKIFHDSFKTFLEYVFQKTLPEYRKTLVEKLWNWRDLQGELFKYAILWLPIHLEEIDDEERLRLLLEDPAFIQASENMQSLKQLSNQL